MACLALEFCPTVNLKCHRKSHKLLAVSRTLSTVLYAYSPACSTMWSVLDVYVQIGIFFDCHLECWYVVNTTAAKTKEKKK